MHCLISLVQDSGTQPQSTGVDSPPEIDPACVRTSYSVQTLLRIQTVLRATKQTQLTVAKVRRSIEEKLNQSHTLHKKVSGHKGLNCLSVVIVIS